MKKRTWILVAVLVPVFAFAQQSGGIELEWTYPDGRVKKSHVHEFFAAIREGRLANADFRYGVPLVKTVLMGNVLAQTGLGKLEWDGKRITNNEAANAYVKATYRKGWELPV